MSKLDSDKKREGKPSRDQGEENKIGKNRANDTHLDRIAITRNMPPRKQALEAPIESATGLGGQASATRPPGTTNEVPLTTATGSVSESEQRIAASPYGKFLPPQLTPKGKFKCRCCSQIFDTSNEYEEHYNQNHLPQM